MTRSSVEAYAFGRSLGRELLQGTDSNRVASPDACALSAVSSESAANLGALLSQAAIEPQAAVSPATAAAAELSTPVEAFRGGVDAAVASAAVAHLSHPHAGRARCRRCGDRPALGWRGLCGTCLDHLLEMADDCSRYPEDDA